MKSLENSEEIKKMGADQARLDELFNEMKGLMQELLEKYSELKAVGNFIVMTRVGTASLYLPLQEDFATMSDLDLVEYKTRTLGLIIELELSKQSLVNNELNSRFRQMKKKE